MSEMKNVDDVLVKTINDQLSANNQPPIPEPPATIAPKPPQVENNENSDVYGVESSSTEQKSPENEEKTAVSAEKPQESVEKSPIDEYGNPTDKPKMYTEDELQGILRDRIARIKTNQPTKQEIKEISDDFKADANSDESWQVQLETFIENTIDKRQKKRYEEEWRARETQKQAEFEEKFTLGMNKYKDFREVVSGKPITDTMMIATRELENPAAFIYAVSKLHPQELERIANIQDHNAQAVAVGRLHEKMIRTRQQAANTKPILVPKGDMPAKSSDMPSLESRIQSYGEQKRRR